MSVLQTRIDRHGAEFTANEAVNRGLAAELRENLRRRKAQERGRKAPATGEGTKRPAYPPRGD